MKNLTILLVLFYASVVFGRDTPTDTVRYKTQSSDASTPSSGYINNYFLSSDGFPYFRNSSGTINGYLYSQNALTANGILYGAGTRSPSVLAACTNNTVLVGNTGSAPSCRQINGSDVVATASIGYSKLNLASSILASDIADNELSLLGGLTAAADKIPYFSATNSAGLVTIGGGLSFSGGTLSATGSAPTIYGWNGYHGTDCSWTGTSTTLSDFSADASCTFTQMTNTNFGTVNSADDGTNKRPGIKFTVPATGLYYVSAFVSIYNNTTIQAALALTDGTTDFGYYNFNNAGGSANERNPGSVHGIYSGTSGASVQIRLKHIVDSTRSTTIGGDAGYESGIHWSIFKIN